MQTVLPKYSYNSKIFILLLKHYQEVAPPLFNTNMALKPKQQVTFSAAAQLRTLIELHFKALFGVSDESWKPGCKESLQ